MVLLSAHKVLCDDGGIFSFLSRYEAADYAYVIIVGYCLFMFFIVVVFWLSPKKPDAEEKKKE